MPDDNAFIGLPIADLEELQRLYVQVLKDIALAGKSYAFPQRSFTRADIGDVKALLSEIRVAAQVETGTRSQIAYARIDTLNRFSR